jgi:hypothetical protein
VADAVEIVIGSTERERLVLRVLGRSHPGATDYWDGNWVRVHARVTVGMFAGEVSCDLRTEELMDFRAQLARLYESVEGDAAFATMEGWLTLDLHGDHSGHVRVDGELFDRAGRMGNALRFSVQIDQSYLPPILAALVEVEAHWPIQGRP